MPLSCEYLEGFLPIASIGIVGPRTGRRESRVRGALRVLHAWLANLGGRARRQVHGEH